jgi:response regulator RpfG family c-di-GMP phosphodiesterase
VYNDSLLALLNFKPGFYELIIPDIRMPTMDGLQLCRKITKIDNKAKVCFLTASEKYNEIWQTSFQELDQDGRCFISKPIALDDFVNRVKEELN